MKVNVNFYNEDGKKIEADNLSEVSKMNYKCKNVYVVISKDNGEFLERMTLRNFTGEILFVPLENNK